MTVKDKQAMVTDKTLLKSVQTHVLAFYELFTFSAGNDILLALWSDCSLQNQSLSDKPKKGLYNISVMYNCNVSYTSIGTVLALP